MRFNDIIWGLFVDLDDAWVTSQSLLLSFESRLQPPSSSAGYLEASVTMNVLTSNNHILHVQVCK